MLNSLIKFIKKSIVKLLVIKHELYSKTIKIFIYKYFLIMKKLVENELRNNKRKRYKY